MKVLSLLVVAAAAVFALTGCTTYYKDAAADYLYRPEITAGAPYYTEYSIADKRVTGKGNASVLFGIFQFAEQKECLTMRNPNLSFLQQLSQIFSPTYKAVENAKNVALYNACAENEADHLMGLTFDYIIRDYLIYASVECHAKGFPAQVKGIKMVDKKPIILNKWQKIEYIAPHEQPVQLRNDSNVSSLSLMLDSLK